MNNPRKVIVHCAATSDALPRHITVKDVDRWHRERGFNGIGYHFYIEGEGGIQIGRDLSVVGAHTKKGHNRDSIGVCYDGTQLPTVKQILSIIILYRKFKTDFGIGWADWYGHKELDEKTKCPGFEMEDLRLILRKIEVL